MQTVSQFHHYSYVRQGAPTNEPFCGLIDSLLASPFVCVRGAGGLRRVVGPALSPFNTQAHQRHYVGKNVRFFCV